jgi:hypothetical protein
LQVVYFDEKVPALTHLSVNIAGAASALVDAMDTSHTATDTIEGPPIPEITNASIANPNAPASAPRNTDISADVIGDAPTSSLPLRILASTALADITGSTLPGKPILNTPTSPSVNPSNSNNIANASTISYLSNSNALDTNSAASTTLVPEDHIANAAPNGYTNPLSTNGISSSAIISVPGY